MTATGCFFADASRAVRAVGQYIAEEAPEDDHTDHHDDTDQGGDHPDADAAPAGLVAVTATKPGQAWRAAGLRRRGRGRWSLVASREAGEVVRRIDVDGGQVPLGLLGVGEVVAVIVSGVVEVEKPSMIVKVVVKLLGRPSRITRRGGGIGVGRFARRDIPGFAIAAGVPELLRPGIVVRRFVGRLVVIRCSVPTHAGPLLGAGGACNV